MIQSCRIHDLMREIIQLKCKEENFVRVLNEKHVTPGEKVRHLAIHLNSEYFPANINKSRLRSLLVFTPEDPSYYLQHTFLSGYRFLRVLDLDHAPLSKLPRELVKLVYLRYLSLKMTWIKELPKSIGKLSSLEILDLKGTLISSLPNGILKLKNLVELQNYHVSKMYDNKGMTVPKGIRSLTNLQKLGSIELQQGDHTLAELGELTQLKRLGILKLRRENEEELCSCLQKLRHLTSLYTVSISNEEHLKLDPLQYPPMSLQHLDLKCTLTAFPEWVASLPYLSKLVLQSSNLNTDPLEALQNLPNLVILDLCFAYNGQELRCNPSGYPKLKKFVLYQMENLERVHVAKGAMPMLRGLLISCFELETVPLGIEHLTDIEELQLLDMPQQFVKRIERPRGVDFWKVEHIPTLKHVYRGRGRWETEIL